MQNKAIRWLIRISGTIVFLAFCFFAYQLYAIQLRLAPPLSHKPARTSVLQYLSDTLIKDSLFVPPSPLGIDSTLAIEQFIQPEKTYRPWVKWWWPGNGVDQNQLDQQIEWFEKTGFGGLEIQAITAGLASEWLAEEESDILGFDTEGFYRNLRWVLSRARNAGLEVDLAVGSGWPTGGSHIALQDNVKSLFFAESLVLGGKEVKVPLPELSTPISYFRLAFQEHLNGSRQLETLDFYPDSAQLLCLLATKPISGKRKLNPFNLLDQVLLNPDSIFIITDRVNARQEIVWEAPKGYWKLIAVYAGPDGEKPIFNADSRHALAVNPLDANRVVANYQYLLGNRTGLVKRFGKELRGIFIPAPNYNAERLFADDLLGEFSKRRGYELTPYLPVLSTPGYNNSWIEKAHQARIAEYRLTDWDERIGYDYDLTIAELYTERFLENSTSWAQKQGLRFRVQTQGLPIDLIQAAGTAHIPEASQGYAGGTALYLKLISSGAHHFQKPLLSAESFAFKNQDYSFAPQKLKAAADKLFGLGFNHLVFHGAPYRFAQDNSPSIAWRPFSSPHLLSQRSAMHFQSEDPFATHWPAFNAYVSRCQYLLRKGEAEAEVLIYYPFLGFPPGYDAIEAHQEFYFRGFVPSLDAADKLPNISGKPVVPEAAWLLKVSELTRQLDAQGISWEWVNGPLLQEAIFADQQWQIKGRKFSCLILPETPYIELSTARQIHQLFQEGASCFIYGQAPQRQPGFRDFQAHDAEILALMDLVQLPEPLDNPRDMINRLQQLPVQPSYRYETAYPFLRHHQRRLKKDEQIIFFHNIEAEGRYFRIVVPPEETYAYWLEPMAGKIYPATANKGNNVLGFLEGYASAFLYCRPSPLPDSLVSKRIPLPLQMANARNMVAHSLQDWKLLVQTQPGEMIEIEDSIFFDWRDKRKLRYTDAEGAYSARFYLQDTLADIRYVLELGEVYHSADVYLNTRLAGKLAYIPYQLDISDHLQPGWNQVEIWLTPTALNARKKQAQKGHRAYRHLRPVDLDALQPAGMLGPVVLWELLPQGEM
jgi:hypothetical protein